MFVAQSKGEDVQPPVPMPVPRSQPSEPVAQPIPKNIATTLKPTPLAVEPGPVLAPVAIPPASNQKRVGTTSTYQQPVKRVPVGEHPVGVTQTEPPSKILIGAVVGALVLALGGGSYWYYGKNQLVVRTQAVETVIPHSVPATIAVPAPDKPLASASTPAPMPTPAATPAESKPPVLVAPPVETSLPAPKSIAASTPKQVEKRTENAQRKFIVESDRPARPTRTDDSRRASDKAKLDRANKTLDDLLK
jgi:hypothetical protein